MKQTLRANLLALADALGANDGPSRPAIARQALNDNTFFTRVERGENFTIGTYDRLVEWCADNWPADAEWPEGVQRPQRLPAPAPEPAQ